MDRLAERDLETARWFIIIRGLIGFAVVIYWTRAIGPSLGNLSSVGIIGTFMEVLVNRLNSLNANMEKLVRSAATE